MATIKSKAIIKEMLQNGGRFEDDPPAIAIYIYNHSIIQGEHFAVFWRESDIDMHLSPSVRSYSPLLRKGQLTTLGKIWLREAQEEEQANARNK